MAQLPGICARCRGKLGRAWNQLFVRKSCPEVLTQKFEKSRRKYALRSLRIGTTVSTVMCVFYFFVSGLGTPERVFFRVQSALSTFFAISFTCSAHLNQRIFDHTSSFVFVCLLHYVAYSTLTFNRAGYLLGVEVDYLEEEAYTMMLNYFVIAVCGHFNILKLPLFLAICMFAPLCWVVQINVLGTEHGTQDCVRMGALYFVLCALAFVGARRSHSELLSEFSRNARERSELLHALENASVPIMLVGESEDHTDLHIELWNRSLQELTQPVPKGSSLSGLNCFHPKHRDVLASKILEELELAKSTEPIEGSKRQGLLVQVVGASGVTWLQVDIWPVNMDQPMAIMLGSDVTHFVSKHSSLLHKAGEPPAKLNDKNTMRMFAVLDSWSFVLLECSVGFNVFFQHRMETKMLLQWIQDPNDKKAVLSAAAKVMEGCEPQVLVVQVRANHIRSHRTHLKRIWPKVKPVQITISLEDTNREEQESSGSPEVNSPRHRRIPLLRIELVGEAMSGYLEPRLAMIPEKARSEAADDTQAVMVAKSSETWVVQRTHSEPARRSKFVVRSPHAEPVDVSVGGLGEATVLRSSVITAGSLGSSEADFGSSGEAGICPWTIGNKTASEPARNSEDMVLSPKSLPAMHSNSFAALDIQQSPTAPGISNEDLRMARTIPSKALEGCLAELARHLRQDSLEASMYYFHVTIAALRSNLQTDRHVYFEACSSWECPNCFAMNDEEDECCEICKSDRDVEQAEQNIWGIQTPAALAGIEKVSV